MTRERFEALIQVTGPIEPEGIEDHIGDLSCSETELLPKEALQFTLDWNHVPLDQQAQLMSALDAANAVPELVELSHIMALDAVRALNRCTAIDFQPPKPACLSGFDRDAFAFLYSQLCVIEGRKRQLSGVQRGRVGRIHRNVPPLGRRSHPLRYAGLRLRQYRL